MALGNIFDPNNVAWMEMFTGTLQVFGIIFWTLLGVALVIVAWWWVTFNIPIHIYEVVGKEQVLRFLKKTRARIKEKDGVMKMKVWGVKEDYQPPQSEQYMLGKRGKLLNLKKDGTDFAPFQMTANPGNIVVQDHDMRLWHSMTRINNVKKYTEQSWFQKYGTYITFIGGMLILGWMFYIQLKFINGNLQETTSAASRLADAMKAGVGAP